MMPKRDNERAIIHLGAKRRNLSEINGRHPTGSAGTARVFAQALPPRARARPEMVPFAAANCTTARIAAHLGSHDRTTLDIFYVADTDGWPRFLSGQVPPEPLHALIRRKG